MDQNRQRRHGFTLIEVLVAIAIVVALIGLVAVNVVGSRKQAKVDLAKIELASMQDALEQFNLVFDRYPTEEEGLSVLWSNETLETEEDAESTQWRKFLNSPKPNDPWGNEWNYSTESERGADYDLWSNGPDGEEGTEDDITSWDDSESDEFGGAGDVPPPPPSS